MRCTLTHQLSNVELTVNVICIHTRVNGSGSSVTASLLKMLMPAEHAR